MNSISTFIRQKPKIEVVFQMSSPVVLCNPREDKNGNMYVCSQAGEILKFTDDGGYTTYHTLGGMPICIAFDNKAIDNTENEFFYFADVANAVIYVKKTGSEINLLFKDYEGYVLKGPTSLAINREESYLLICDGGHQGSTSLNRPFGSVFHFDLETNIVKPLLLNCLAYPSDIYFDENTGIVYISEMYNNRILRLLQNPHGIFHCSVFHTFNGRVGPSALASDELGNIYTSRFEYQDKEGSVNGNICILSKEGVLIGELILPKMSEITGMFIPKSKSKANVLYFTERNFPGVLKIKLSQFNSETDKTQDNH